MKNRFLPVFVILFTSLFCPKLEAQTNFTIEIVGPDVLCVSDCAYYKVISSDGSTLIGTFVWSVNGGVQQSTTINELFICAQGLFPGSNVISVVFIGSNNNIVAEATLIINVVTFQPLDILSDNLAPCNFDSTGNPGGGNDCEKVCPNTTVTYSVAASTPPSGTTSQYTWQVTGASSYTVNPPFFNSVTVVWGGPGVGSVSVFSNDSSGCFGEDVLCVTIVDEPEADFSADPAPVNDTIQVCKGQTVYFENLSSGADSYEWLFTDDLSGSFLTDAEHTYLTPGTYLVQLIARSECLCADTIVKYVTVLDGDAPLLDCVGTICPGETVTYTSSNACPPYNWTVSTNGAVVGGGTTTSDSISIMWSDGPEGIITLSADACSGNLCPEPTSIHVPIISDNAEIVGEDQVCPAAVEVYSIDAYGGTGFVWSLSGGGVIAEGQGANRIRVEWTSFSNPSTSYWVSVKYDNCYLGCGGEDSLEVRVLSSYYISGPVEICENANGDFNTSLTSNGSPISCNWTLFAPDGSIVWTAPAASASVSAPFANGPGVYRLLATPADPTLSCTDNTDWAIRVAPQPAKPTGILGQNNICPGTTYNYEAAGIAPAGKVRWTVQNGAAAPVVTFGSRVNVTWGSADPRWIAAEQLSTDGLNCSSDTIRLDVQSISAVTVNGPGIVCENATESYAILPLEGTDIQWSITPPTAGAVASGQGTSNAEIFWTEAGGHVVTVNVCGQTDIFPVTVIAPPDPMVQHPANLCPAVTALVQTGTPFSAYSWRDATGNEIATTATVNLEHGSYAVRVEDPNGCPGVAEFTIEKNPQPNISITTADPTGFCNNSVSVTLTTLTTADGDFTYEWFRDGTPQGVNAPTFTTNQYGSYTVQATNSFGCTASAGNIVLYNFCGGGGGGPGIPGVGGPICPSGAVDIGTAATAVCDSFDFQVIGGPLYLPGSADWIFRISGGSTLGTINDMDNVGFTFPNAGIYLSILRATLQDGSVCYVVDSVKVTAVAQFSAQTDCAGFATDFQDVSTMLPGTSIADWNWNFGDPPSGGSNISSIRNPSHVYASPGTADVTLIVTADNGCTATEVQTLTIPHVEPAMFSPPLVQCAGNALEFNAITTPDMTEIAWNFGDMASGGANDATGSTVYHNYSTPSNYAVTTTSTNAYGCEATFTQIITITPNALVGNIVPDNPPPLCEGDSLTLTIPTPAASYLWSDSLTTTQTFVAFEEGLYTVTLTDASGCTFAPPPVEIDITPAPDAIIKALLMNELGQIVGTSFPTLTVCEGEDVHLTVQGAGPYGYVWSGGNGTNNDVVFSDENNNLLTVGTHIFTVTVTDFVTGCTSVTAPFTVTVNPVPSGFTISASGACAGSPNVLTYNGPQPPNWQLFWNTGAPGPQLITGNAGTYFIRVVNEFGCEAKSDPLVILPGPHVEAVPSGCHSRCRPDTLCLPVIPDLVSLQWYYNGSPIPGATDPTLVVDQSGAYYAELTDIYGCTNLSDPLTLDLYDGSGNINGEVWSDVNGNGVIDAGDTLISGITVNLLQNGMPVGTGQSAANGAFSFNNVLSTSYLVAIDTSLLPSGWEVVIGENAVDLVGCGAIGNSALLLHICPPLLSNVQLMACANGSAVYNGVDVPAGTTQNFLLQTSGGCDSTVVVTVDPIPTSGSTLAVNVCPSEVYDYNGNLILPGETKEFIYQNYLGCDSTVTVSVSEVPTSSSSLSVSTCPGTLYDYDGTMLAPGDSQDFIYQNVWGCDSTVTVSVEALPASYQVVDAVVCAGDTLYVDGVGIPSGSSYIFSYMNSNGCDSIIEVSVGALLPPPVINWQVGVCPGEMYQYNGQSYAPGDTATVVLPGLVGCDTIVQIAVTQLQPSASAFDVGVCPGESFQYQGVSLTAGTVQDFVLDNFVGCDSVVTVTVIELPSSAELISVDACPGTNYSFNGVDIPAGTTQEFQYDNIQGCDSIITVAVNAFPEVNFAIQEESSCETTPTGSITVDSPAGGLAPYRFSIDGVSFQDSLNFAGLAAGDYTVVLEDSNGCLFEQDATVTAYPRLDISLLDAALPCEDPEVQLAVQVNGNAFGLSFVWSNGSTAPFANFTDIGPVWVEVSDHCETVHRDAEITWDDSGSGVQFVYVPNVIAPASVEPGNAEFKPYFKPNLEILTYQLEVFDRWGTKMFGTTDPARGWNGRFRADDLNPGVYVWYLRARVSYCGRERELYFEGDVTIVR